MPTPKQPSRPGIPIPAGDDSDSGSGRHRACGLARVAIAKTERFAQRLDDHIDEDDDRLAALSRDVEQVSKKVETVSEHVGDLRVDMAKVSATLEGISSTLAEQNEIKHMRVIAEVETGKVAKIAEIEDASDRKRSQRAFWMKVLYGVVAALGAAIGALIRRFH